VEIDVVDEEHLRIVERCEETGHLVRQRGHLIEAGPFGGEAGGPHLEDAAGLVHFLPREAVQRGEEAQRLGDQRRRAVRNIGARAVPRSDDTHGGEGAQPGADRGTAHADVRCKVALGRQAVSPAQFPALDQRADMGHHLFGAPLGVLVAAADATAVRRGRGRTAHDWFAQLCQITDVDRPGQHCAIRAIAREARQRVPSALRCSSTG
jgi:hypothetical protein